jgi:hypothetical protein
MKYTCQCATLLRLVRQGNCFYQDQILGLGCAALLTARSATQSKYQGIFVFL